MSQAALERVQEVEEELSHVSHCATLDFLIISASTHGKPIGKVSGLLRRKSMNGALSRPRNEYGTRRMPRWAKLPAWRRV